MMTLDEYLKQTFKKIDNDLNKLKLNTVYINDNPMNLLKISEIEIIRYKLEINNIKYRQIPSNTKIKTPKGVILV